MMKDKKFVRINKKKPKTIPHDSVLNQDSQGNPSLLPVPVKTSVIPRKKVSVVKVEKPLSLPEPIQRYLYEIRKFPLLSLEEERRLAIEAFDLGNLESRQKLVTANLRLVVKIAMEYRRAYSQMLDLIQEGNAGLVQAVQRFNPYKGVKLSTYSAWWIRAYILKFLMDNKSLVRMGTTDAQRKLFFNLRAEAEKMYALTKKFDPVLLAETIGVKEQDVIDMEQRLTQQDISLDAPHHENDDHHRFSDTLEGHEEDPELHAEKEEIQKIVKARLSEFEKELTDRDKYIFKNRIISDSPITLQDLGNHFGITRERARQLEARILERIKEKLEDLR